MTTPIQQFDAEARRQLRRLPRMQRDTLREVVAELRVAQREIAALLAGDLTDGRRNSLVRLQSEVDRSLEAFERRLTPKVVAAANNAWAAGVDLVEKPVALLRLELNAVTINTRVLEAMGRFLIDRIDDISRKAKDRINSALAQAVIGLQDQATTIAAVNQILGGEALSRARTIVYTELGRAHSIAADAALQSRALVVPGLRKRWVQSTKRHRRPAHVAAHNQLRSVNDPFQIGGEAMRYPRDPDASAKNTINCGCGMVPVVDGTSLGASRMQGDRPLLDPAPNAAQLSVIAKRRRQNNPGETTP